MHIQDHEDDMTRYKDYAPTPMDPAGLNLPDRQDWIVAPCSITRDSEALSRSNWEVMCRGLLELDPGHNDHEIHRFGHWGPGWFEIVLVRPNTPASRNATEAMCSLSDYPILDEMHFSELEWNEASNYWESLNIADRVELCQRFDINALQARHDYIPHDDNGSLLEYLRD